MKMGYDDEGGRQGRFNAGIAAAERLDSLQRVINSARFNPLLVQPETQTYKFQVMKDAIDGLVGEGRAKFSEAEQLECNKLKDLVELFLKYNYPITPTKDGPKVNPLYYEKLMKLLCIYENKVKGFLDIHNLNNPNAEDDYNTL